VESIYAEYTHNQKVNFGNIWSRHLAKYNKLGEILSIPLCRGAQLEKFCCVFDNFSPGWSFRPQTRCDFSNFAIFTKLPSLAGHISANNKDAHAQFGDSVFKPKNYRGLWLKLSPQEKPPFQTQKHKNARNWTQKASVTSPWHQGRCLFHF